MEEEVMLANGRKADVRKIGDGIWGVRVVDVNDSVQSLTLSEKGLDALFYECGREQQRRSQPDIPAPEPVAVAEEPPVAVEE